MKRRKSIHNKVLNIICAVALVLGSIGVPGVSYVQGADVEGVFSDALSEDGTETTGSLSGSYPAAASQTYDFAAEYTVQTAEENIPEEDLPAEETPTEEVPSEEASIEEQEPVRHRCPTITGM